MMARLSGNRALGTFTAGLFVLLVAVANAEMNETEMMDYLKTYGYMSTNDSDDNMYEKLKMFQEMAGMNATGEMDEETEKMMKMPRCGMVDMTGMGMHMRRRKRYTLQGSKWRRRYLTYKITRYTRKLSRSVVDRAIVRAFKVWSDVSRLTFRRTSGRADIVIFFASGSHGDGTPFDGPRKVLAHAFYPRYGGDAHFDESETWTDRTSRGFNLFQVAAHEFGHSLGLAHSRVKGALMAPFYRGYQSNFKLHLDDIRAIRILYGSRYVPPVDVCSNSRIDAATRTRNGLTYVFKGTNYYRLNDIGRDRGYPRVISRDWKGVTGPINAALTDRNGYTFLFKGSLYWRFWNQIPLAGNPRRISSGFRGIPSNLDAAFRWSGNGHIYFIKGSLYYRYYHGRGRAPGYPRPLRVWRGLPSRIDAAFQWKNSRTYFFYGNNYYRFNDKTVRVDTANPRYPRKISYWWFGCRTSGSLGADGNDTIQHESQSEVNQYDDPLTNSTILPSANTTQTNSGLTIAAGLAILVPSFFVIFLPDMF